MRQEPTIAALLVLSVTALSRAEKSAEEIIHEAGICGGVVVHLGCGDGKLTTALQTERDSCLVQGLDVDRAMIQRARRRIHWQGAAGRVSAVSFDGENLPYADNLVNLLVVSDAFDVERDEMYRVLVPGGMAISARPSSASGPTIRKPWPAAIDQWTHFLHGPDNNAVSHDQVVASPRCLQWVSDPVYGRHHNRLASVSAMVSSNGRLFSIEDRGPALSMNLPADWRLIARDAFNGLKLWELPIHQWQTTNTGFRSGPVGLPRRLVAFGDRVYAALDYGGPLRCLDGATGETRKTYAGTEGVGEILYVDKTLYLVATDMAAEPSRRIIAVEAETGRVIWQNASGPARSIMAATLTVGRKRLFFHDGQAVVAIDRADGQVCWR
jgi:SAM-dependent methyltransferase